MYKKFALFKKLVNLCPEIKDSPSHRGKHILDNRANKKLEVGDSLPAVILGYFISGKSAYLSFYLAIFS